MRRRVIFFTAAFVLFLFPSIGRPATITVTSGSSDELTTNGSCSLREAIINANNDLATFEDCTAGSGDDTISIPAGTYTLSIGESAGGSASTGDLDITDGLILSGAGADATIIDGSGMTADPDRVFVISAPAEISNLKITGGNSQEANGGGIYSASSLTFSNVTLSGNKASFSSSPGYGGGLYWSGSSDETLTVTGSTISGNELSNSSTTSNAYGGGFYVAGGGSVTIFNSVISENTISLASSLSSYKAKGGGIYLQSATATFSNNSISENEVSSSNQVYGGGLYTVSSTVTISHSTFYGNTLYVSGGSSLSGFGIAIYNDTSTLNVSNSTFSGNQSATRARGGALFNDTTGTGSTSLANVTIYNNSTTYQGGGIEIYRGTVTLKNSVLSGNSSYRGADCYGSLSSGGYNLIGDTTSCTVDDKSTHLTTGTDSLIESLADNGGATRTHALQVTSPLTNAGNPSGCTDADGVALSTDQRGASRSGTCDIGAYEYGGSEGECSDSEDNDNDDFTDGDDSDCGGTETSCTDSADNDGDGSVDCDDSDCATNSACTGGSAETECADSTDNDGDGAADCDDSDCSGSCSTWYRDSDGDGYGASDTRTSAVSQPSGYVTNQSDCDDGNSAVSPAGAETCGDDIDQDCSGSDIACASSESDSGSDSGSGEDSSGEGSSGDDGTADEDSGADDTGSTDDESSSEDDIPPPSDDTTLGDAGDDSADGGGDSGDNAISDKGAGGCSLVR